MNRDRRAALCVGPGLDCADSDGYRCILPLAFKTHVGLFC